MGLCLDMSWRWAAASVAGTSHLACGQPCQDANCVKLLPACGGAEVLAAVVADGAGSARFGGEAALLAVHTAMSFLEKLVAGSVGSLDPIGLGRCVLLVREELARLAEERRVEVRECACTFLVALVTQEQSVTLQVGDGAIVLDFGDGLVVATRPMTGEYANTTFFITDSESQLADAEVIWHGGPAKRVSVFTDGLQFLALARSQADANPAFFHKRFATLEATSPELLAQLDPALAGFLACDAVNRATDDDKTLVLAVNMQQ